MIRSKSLGDLYMPSGADGLSWSSRDQAKKTVVSFVMKDSHSEEQEQKKHTEAYTWTILVSCLYALFLVLTGIVFTVSEALMKGWHTTRYVSIFNGYLFCVSIVFLVFIQVTVRRQRKCNASDSHSTLNTDNLSLQSGTSKQEADSVSKDTRKPIPKDAMVLHLRNVGVESGSPGSSSVCSTRTNSPSPFRKNRTSLPDVSGLVSQNSLVDDNTATAYTRKRSVATLVDSCGETVTLDMEGDYDEDEFEEQIILLQQTASQGHVGASFYLRIGCLLFSVANLVYVSLELRGLWACSENMIKYPMVLHLVFLLVQTFFLLKSTTIHVKKYKSISRFGFQHLIATNLIIWIRVLVKEIIETFDHYSLEGLHADNNTSSETPVIAGVSEYDCKPHPFMSSVSPYLFPFVLEYSLVAVAVMAGMYQSLNLCIKVDLLENLKKAIREKPQVHTNDAHEEPLLSRSHTGLYLGVLALTAGTLFIIVFFLYSSEHDGKVSHVTSLCFIVCINALQIMALFAGFYFTRQLHFTFSRSNDIDATLLMFAMAGSILMHLFISVANIEKINDGDYETDDITVLVLDLTSSFFEIIFLVTQTCFILDGLQRYSGDKTQQKKKPGRGFITFLVITNVTMWLFNSLTAKKIGYASRRYYGDAAWPIISNIGIPLGLFYNFHSSVCLADIWSLAYVAAEETTYKIF